MYFGKGAVFGSKSGRCNAKWSAPVMSDRHSQLDRVVGGVNQILLGTQVAFGRLNRRMPQQQLDLFKLAARGPTQLRARVTQVVGWNAGLLGIRFDELGNARFLSEVSRRTDSTEGAKVKPGHFR